MLYIPPTRKMLCATWIALLFLLSSAVTAQEPGEQLVPFETLSNSSQSGVRERQNLVITDRQEFKRLWKAIYSFTSEKAPLPEVDFTKQMVIGVFLGATGPSRTRISIMKVVKDGKRLGVFIRETLENPACPGPPIEVQPYHLIAVDLLKKPQKNVSFELPEQVVQTCLPPHE